MISIIMLGRWAAREAFQEGLAQSGRGRVRGAGEGEGRCSDSCFPEEGSYGISGLSGDGDGLRE